MLREAKEDVRDDIVGSFGLLEEAMPITISTFVHREATHLTGTAMHRMYFANDLADFCSIGADILHGSSPDLAWDEREILDAIEISFRHLCHKIIPLNTRTNQEVYRILRLTTAL